MMTVMGSAETLFTVPEAIQRGLSILVALQKYENLRY